MIRLLIPFYYLNLNLFLLFCLIPTGLFSWWYSFCPVQFCLFSSLFIFSKSLVLYQNLFLSFRLISNLFFPICFFLFVFSYLFDPYRFDPYRFVFLVVFLLPCPILSFLLHIHFFLIFVPLSDLVSFVSSFDLAIVINGTSKSILSNDFSFWLLIAVLVV